MIKILFLVIPGILAFSLSPGKGTSKSGTVIADHRESGGWLISMRGNSGSVALLTLGKSAHVTTGDGRTLQASDIRLGDRLTVKNGTQIQDLSQRVASMRGIISVAPLDMAEPMVLQITPSLTISVDTGSQTHYADSSHETSMVSQLEDADILQIHGVYDSALGEMTWTDQISRLGPFHQEKHQTRKK